MFQKSVVKIFSQFTGLERDSLRNDFRSPPAKSSRIINLFKRDYLMLKFELIELQTFFTLDACQNKLQ